MAIMKIFAGLILIAHFALICGDPFPCPFNTEECQCYNYTFFPPVDFAEVYCTSKSGSRIDFSVPQGIQYKIGRFSMTANLADLPANYFTPFPYIDQLQLRNVRSMKQSWDQGAFDGCEINRLDIFNVDGMLPPPRALSGLGTRGLWYLTINNSTQSIRLLDSQFQKFSSLQYLIISDIPIAQIDNSAFDGLENLVVLNFINTRAVGGRPDFGPFMKLRSISEIQLSNTGIIEYPINAFSGFPQLSTLGLSNDNLSLTALDNFPSTFSRLQLLSVGLTNVPRVTFVKGQKNPLSMDISGNQIRTIRSTDFGGDINYSYIQLSSNPISVIEKGAGLTGLVYFEDEKLTTVDLSAFSNADIASFERNPFLKSVVVSNLEKSFKLLSVSVNPALETVDSRLASVFDRFPAVKFDMRKNTRLDCDEISWMAPYVLCSKKADVDGSYCSNGQLATDYFKGMAYNCSHPMI